MGDSEPIKLTERERAVFEAFAAELERSKILYRQTVGDAIREWLAALSLTASASPPRVPVDVREPASMENDWAKRESQIVQSPPLRHAGQWSEIPDARKPVGVESEPGPPIVGSTTEQANMIQPHAVPVTTPRSQPLGAAGVESGPGQPDICERLDETVQFFKKNDEYLDVAAEAHEAAATIRTLRNDLKSAKALHEFRQRMARVCGASMDDARNEGRRAGIEEALRIVRHAGIDEVVLLINYPNAGRRVSPDGSAPTPAEMLVSIAAAIRALADKPAQPKGE